MAITPLLVFLRALTKEQRLKFAEDCGTTEIYLYQLAAQPRPNPALRLATDMVRLSKPLAKRQMTQALSYELLMVGNDDPAPPKPRRRRRAEPGLDG